ncbi:MAG: lasso peptide [Cyanobacteria bacterium J06623_7]
MKKTYSKPQLTVHGNVEALTKANTVGSRLDAGFPAQTLVSDLTLS